MSPQEIERNATFEAAEADAHSMLGVSLGAAFAMLDAGRLDGTAAEAHLRMLRFVLADA